LQQQAVPDLQAFVEHLVTDVGTVSVALMVSKPVLGELAKQLCELPPAVHKEVASFTLDKVQARVVSFEEQVPPPKDSACLGRPDHGVQEHGLLGQCLR